jgi:transcription initiation factor IIE alpha subunit
MIRQTSIMAYAGRKLDTKVHHQILEILQFHPDSTDFEISLLLGYSNPNVVRPRRNELMHAGLVRSTGKRTCQWTGKTALTWRRL